MTAITPLLGHFDSFEELFTSWRFVARTPGQAFLPPEDRFVLLTGLPGSIDLKRGLALFVKPRPRLRSECFHRCTLNAIGGFRIIRSAELMKEGKLPVYCHDQFNHNSFLVATLPYSEHERFNL